MSNLLLVPPRDSQLRSVNQKLSDLSARHPYGEVVELFALAAYLASEAVAAGTSLRNFPGGDAGALKAVIEFCRVPGTILLYFPTRRATRSPSWCVTLRGLFRLLNEHGRVPSRPQPCSVCGTKS